MKLKARISSLDDIPEQYRSSYTQDADGKGWSLDEIEFDDATGLKANHDRLLKQHKASQEELKRIKDTFGDLDPTAAREALKKLEDLESQKLMDEGKFEELYNKRSQTMVRDHENQVKALNDAIEKHKGRVSTLEGELQRMTIANELNTHAGRLKIKPEFLSFLQLAAKEAWTLDEDGKPVWKENGQVRFGKDGSKPATMEEYLAELIGNTPSLLESSAGNGSNGNGRPSNGLLTISARDMRDVRKYEAVKAAAEKQGLPLSAIQVTDT